MQFEFGNSQLGYKLIWALFILSTIVSAGSIAAAVVFALCFSSRFNRSEDTNSAADSPPSIVVILCVRGPDPFLTQTIRAIAKQDYSNYRLLIVVDHQQDPAWPIVEQAQAELIESGIEIEVQSLQNHATNRGLKCSALLQAMSTIGEEIVVTIDSDAVPRSSWLKDLTIPLQDPSIGATTGNQWFEPTGRSIGAWTRSVWHAGAIVPTAVLGNPWAGAFAMRRNDIVASGLLEDWSKSIIDDGPVTDALKRLRKGLRFVPATISINREDCDLRFCFRYVGRMLTWSRIFESTFWITLLHMIVYVGCNIAAVLMLLLSVIWFLFANDPGNWMPLLALNFGVLLTSQLLGYFVIRHTVFSNLPTEARNESNRQMSIGTRLICATAALPLTLSTYAYGALTAITRRNIVWRQIHYRLKSRYEIQLLDYQPYQNRDELSDPAKVNQSV